MFARRHCPTCYGASRAQDTGSESDWPTLTGHHFKLDSGADALYGALGGVARPPGVGLSKTVGDELDFTASCTIGGHLTALFGYSGFRAGPFIEETGSSDNIDFWYLSLTFGF